MVASIKKKIRQGCNLLGSALWALGDGLGVGERVGVCQALYWTCRYVEEFGTITARMGMWLPPDGPSAV